jgi:trehalose 6-phosphate phosphatase
MVTEALYVFDFDGTLSEIQENPFKVGYVDGSIEMIETLLDRGAHVAILTGRSVRKIKQFFSDELALLRRVFVIGQYGAEYLDDELEPKFTDESFTRFTHTLDELFPENETNTFFITEKKGVSATLHFRGLVPNIKKVLDLQSIKRVEREFDICYGKYVIELVPHSIDKGKALNFLYRKYEPPYCMYAGDDSGDIPAFEMLLNLPAIRKEAICIGDYLSGRLTQLFLNTAVLYRELNGPKELVSYISSQIAEK